MHIKRLSKKGIKTFSAKQFNLSPELEEENSTFLIVTNQIYRVQFTSQPQEAIFIIISKIAYAKNLGSITENVRTFIVIIFNLL